jgi:hypothetical protein
VVGQYAHLDRLALFVAAVINGVDEGFFERCERVIEEAVGLGAIAVLDDVLPFSQLDPWQRS